MRELVRIRPHAVFIKDVHVRACFSEQGRHNLSPTSAVGHALPPTTEQAMSLEVAKVKGMVECRKVGMIRYSPERPVHL